MTTTPPCIFRQSICHLNLCACRALKTSAAIIKSAKQNPTGGESQRHLKTLLKEPHRYSLVDVFHHLELSTRSIDFRYRSWCQFIDKLTQYSTIPDNIFVEFTRWKFRPQNGFNPFLGFLILLRVAFGGNLYTQQHKLTTLEFEHTLRLTASYFGFHLTFQRHLGASLNQYRN